MAEYKLLDVVKKIGNYGFREGVLHYPKGDTLFKYPNIEVGKIIKDRIDIKYGADAFVVIDALGKNVMYSYDGNVIFVSDDVYVYYLFSSKDKIYRDRNNDCIYWNTTQIFNKRIGLKFLYENSLFVESDDGISKIDLSTATVQWQFSLEQLGQFINEDGEEQGLQALAFKSIWKNEIFLALSSRMLIALDINTGVETRRWRELEGYGNIFTDRKLINYLPSTNTFQLSQEENILYSLCEYSYIEIDLISSAVKYISLKDTMEMNHIILLQPGNSYGEDSTHIFTIGQMDGSFFGVDHIPHCLLAFNKSTKEIDWVFRFENDRVLGNDCPEVRGNKIYQKGSGVNLHIFEISDQEEK